MIAGMARNAVILDVGVAVTTVNREACRCPSPGVERIALRGSAPRANRYNSSNRPMPATSIHRTREQAVRPYHQYEQEGHVAGQNLPFRIDVRADRLRQADNDAAGERAPQAAEAADDHRLEGVEKPRRTDARIKVGARAE